MACVFRWIHFSDIHFQTKETSFNTSLLKDRLPEVLKEITQNIDTMIISGDYRYAPDNDENPQRVVSYIKQLAEILKIDDMKRVVTVPGNHDLTRGFSRKANIIQVQSEYDSNKGTINAEGLDELLKSFSYYNRFHDELGDLPVWDKDNPHCVVELENCNLLLLNTALTAYESKKDRGNLVLGSKYIESRLGEIKNNKPIIAVGHHSLTELEFNENKSITHYFDQEGIRLYLCGHSHDQWIRGFGEYGKEITVGCMMQNENDVTAGFEIGELDEAGDVSILPYKWDMNHKVWTVDLAAKRDFSSIYSMSMQKVEDEEKPTKVEKAESAFSIEGYTLLGARGIDGIKYYWKKDDHYVESIALNKRLRETILQSDSSTSAYTISTSFGCLLSTTKEQCKFCETGTKNFCGLLQADEIALQCIFMAEYDRDCKSFPQVRDNCREFAFMGQGEPGYNYLAIRQAILYTDYVMDRIDQKVSRYVISTCGILDFFPSLISDIKNQVFKNPVTIHLSLNDIDETRSSQMPINKKYDYKDVIKYCELLYQLTKTKIGVGILMFYGYKTRDGEEYTLTTEKLEQILDKLDNNVFRIDLCSVNDTSAGKQKRSLSNESAQKLLDVVHKRGFEGKTFSSFGQEQQSGCGMLSSDNEKMEVAGSTTITHFNTSIKLLNEAKDYILSKT